MARRPTPRRNLGVRFTLWSLHLFGNIIRAVAKLLWEAFTDQFRAASKGIASMVKKIVPWAIGICALLFLTNNNPEGTRILFGYVVVIVLLVIGIKHLFRKMFK